jgi:hypothetical protein
MGRAAAVARKPALPEERPNESADARPVVAATRSAAIVAEGIDQSANKPGKIMPKSSLSFIALLPIRQWMPESDTPWRSHTDREFHGEPIAIHNSNTHASHLDNTPDMTHLHYHKYFAI